MEPLRNFRTFTPKHRLVGNLFWGGPLMRMMPLHLHTNPKTDYDDDDESWHFLYHQKLLVCCLLQVQ